MEELLTTRHGHVEETPLVFFRALKASLTDDPSPRQQMPNIPPSNPRGWESVAQECGNEDDRPLHTLGLVHGHYANRVRGGVLVVLPPFRVGVLGAMLEEVREGAVLLQGL